ncbi:MAG: hypothetical protein Fur007_17250 [Rhodoferax sp.]
MSFKHLALTLALGVMTSWVSAQSPVTLDALQTQGARVVAGGPAGAPVRFIGFDALTLQTQAVEAAWQNLPAQVVASQHLQKHAALFGLSDPATQVQLKKHFDEPDGHAMSRYQQIHQGLPVIGGEVIVNQNAKRQLTSISGRTAPQITVDTAPTLTDAEAANTALGAVAKWYGLNTARLKATPAVLSVYDARLISPLKWPQALVWHLEVTPLDELPIREVVLVDAHTGAIAVHFNQIAHARNRLTYDANSTDPSSVAPTLVCNETDATCAGIPDAVKAHRYAANTYDFYSTRFGRDSIDGAGMPLVSHVRICPTGVACPYQNAFWDGSKMSYGAGFADGEDVVAHELTHGVTEKESHLFYYYQSGAINESFSDVFGEFVQQSNVSEPVSPSNRWLIGENLSMGAIRSMSNPPAFNDPDKMTSPYYYMGFYDGGGVHTNSGVNNKAAYLMVDGGTFNGQTVTALGLNKTAQIYYRVQTSLLTSGSDYLDLHNALYQACQDLLGTAGITAADCAAVRAATLAVEMDKDPAPGFMPSAQMCPAGKTVRSTLFFDDMESGDTKWGKGYMAGSTGWYLYTDYAASGIHSFWGQDPSSVSDLYIRNATAVVLPPSAQLWFNHAYQFEFVGSSSYYDAGVLEYSVNGGGTWADAGNLHAEGQNYSGTVKPSFGNPLANRNAFVGESHGYVSSRYDLSSLAGQSVYFRWRVGADSSYGALGWLVDDVSIHTCGVNPVPPGAPTNVSVVSHPGRVTISFSPPASSGSSAITSYTASCSAAGQPTRTGTAAGSPINVYGLTPNVSYACSVTATNSEASSAASAAVTIVGPRRVDMTPILMLLLD